MFIQVPATMGRIGVSGDLIARIPPRAIVGMRSGNSRMFLAGGLNWSFGDDVTITKGHLVVEDGLAFFESEHLGAKSEPFDIEKLNGFFLKIENPWTTVFSTLQKGDVR